MCRQARAARRQRARLLSTVLAGLALAFVVHQFAHQERPGRVAMALLSWASANVPALVAAPAEAAGAPAKPAEPR